MNSANRARAIAAHGWVALALAAGCARGTQTVARQDAALRRAVAAYERAGDSVNVGYGMQRRRDVLGPVATVDLARDASRPRVARLEELLDGRVPGLDVRRLPNGELSLRVRGASSGSEDGEPLFVVDGIPAPRGVSPRRLLADLPPGDVARVDVLKGSAAAVYGSRGANGVVLITLRRDYR